MGKLPYGRLGGAKAYRRNIIVHNAENFKILSYLRAKMLKILLLGMG